MILIKYLESNVINVIQLHISLQEYFAEENYSKLTVLFLWYPVHLYSQALYS